MTLSQSNPARLPDPGDGRPGRIIAVPPERQEEAIERLLAIGGDVDRSRVRRFLEFARANEIALDQLWSSLDAHNRLRHTVLIVPNPGRTAMVFASHTNNRAEIAPIGALIDHACRAVPVASVHLAQTLLEPSEPLEQEAFQAGGFHELARLSYMERSIPRPARLPNPEFPADVTLTAYREEDHAPFAQMLEESYVKTLDCPGLRGLRQTDDIIAGHRATGAFDPQLWRLLRIDGQIRGALLLNPVPASRTVELVYIGLAPDARGRGLGRLMLRHGLHELAVRRERSITLAVDERNAPALKLYEREGFRRLMRRVAMIRSLRAHDCD